MKTFDRSDPDAGPARSHPWVGSSTDASSRYFDFKKNPELVRTALEDLRPWAAWPAVETFYRLVEWLNGRDSVLESNDCAFVGPGANETPQFAKALEATGRLMILWRDLPLNLALGPTEGLKAAIHESLNRSDPDFEWGAVGITVYRVRYVTLPVGRQSGFQLMLSFWSWGDSPEEVMANLDRTFQNLWRGLREVVREAPSAT